MNEKEKFMHWYQNPSFDEEIQKELEEIKDQPKEIEERFYKELTFGTGGLRGIMGAGTNRMNSYTVGKATQGLAHYLCKKKQQEKGVAIAYDSRHHSEKFSKEVALCFNANGIKTYRFSSLRPTPELSFAVRALGCAAGIVITASHNPPEYNGYKVYGEDGGQIVSPMDGEIIKEIEKVEEDQIQYMEEQEAIEKGFYHVIGEEIDQAYQEEIKKLVLHPKVIQSQGKELKIVYSPLHGTGNLPVRNVLKELGFEQVFVVPEQEKPDGGAFPTVRFPNPEDPAAFTLALKLAKQVDADLVLATDPDADRLGVYVKDSKTGEYHPFTGNMSGLLIAEYELSQKKERGDIPFDGVLVKTIVSSNMANRMAEEYNIQVIEVLTGFKYIGEQIKKMEEQKNHTYMFGYEESYGCLLGTYARDKDAVSAVVALCEAACFYREKGLTLWDQMQKIYEKYGYYKETLETVTLTGIEGVETIQRTMQKLRETPRNTFGSFTVEAIRDYQTGKRKVMKTGEEEKISLPKSNVLYYELEEEAWCAIRPSGTEPKLKFYLGVRGNTNKQAQDRLKELITIVKTLL